MNGGLYKINPVKAVTNLGYSKRDIIGPSDKCYSICAAFSSGDDAYRVDPDCAKQCDEFVEKRKHEVYGVGRCDHQAPYRPVIWDNIPISVPKFLKRGKSPEEALNMAKEMCKKVPNLYNECVDLAELHYNAIERDLNVPVQAAPGGPKSPVERSVGSASESFNTFSPVVYETAKEGLSKENYKRCEKNNMLLYVIIFFVVVLIIIFFLSRFKIIKS
jgi:hypothetical protein